MSITNRVASENRHGIGSPVTLLSSAARTADGNGSDVVDATLLEARALWLVLNISAVSGTPTLALEVYTRIAAGQYLLLGRFASETTAVARLLMVQRNQSNGTNAANLVAAPTSAAGAGVANQEATEWNDVLRGAFDISGGSPSVTFSLLAYPLF